MIALPGSISIFGLTIEVFVAGGLVLLTMIGLGYLAQLLFRWPILRRVFLRLCRLIDHFILRGALLGVHQRLDA